MRSRLAATVLVLIAAAAALADRETAQFLATRGDKALAAKTWDEAEGHFRKSLEEDETFLPARYGLAQALVGAGRSAPAVDELRAFVEAAGTTDPLPPEWKALVAKAGKQLAELDALGAALKKLVDSYVEDLVAVAEKWLTKDPKVAERALAGALKFRPGHPRATALLAKLAKAAPAGIALFDGKSFDGWVWAGPPQWQVVDGEIVGDVRGGSQLIRSDRKFEGDFDVSMEARVVERYDEPVMLALLPALLAPEDYYSFGPLRGRVVWTDRTSPADSREVVAVSPPDMKTPFDPTQWMRYEVRFRGNEVHAFVNGQEIAKETRPPNRKGGFVGLLAQNGKFAFRKIQVEVR